MENNCELELMGLIRSTENYIKRSRPMSGNHAPGTGRILAALSRQPGMSQTELAGLLDIRPQSLTRVLVKLEEKGLIRRERSGGDRRSLVVFVTEEGEKAHERIEEKRRARAARIFSCLDPEEKEELKRLLLKVISQEEGGGSL
ncbi:MAG: MarR family transcriptional regulator [Firmicutes bacterium]|nr:MarR family transcriptional regulator [Bacillota bacterium]